MKGIETCPTSEELASVAEGRASTRLREQVLSHVKLCEDCYETLVDTVKMVGSEDLQTALRSAPPAGRWYWYASIAAGILLAVVIPVSIFLLGPSAAPPSEALARALQIDRQPDRLVDSLIDNLDAGLGFSPNLDSRRIAFRLGVRCLDLRVARSAGDAVWLDRTLREMERTLTSGRQFDHPLGIVRQTRQKLDEGSLSSRDISNLESALADIEPEHFQLGSWAESGRLAAASERSALFESPAFSKGLALAQRLDLPQATSSEVARIANFTGKSPFHLTEDQWRSLEKNLFDLIQLLV